MSPVPVGGFASPRRRWQVEKVPTDLADYQTRVRWRIRKEIKYVCRDYFKGTDGRPFRLADFHVEILQAMLEGGYLVVNVPTDHMKSTLGTFLFPLLSLIDNPNETHIICGANLADSKRRVQALELELETNTELVRDFPWIARPDGKEGRQWSATQFNVAGRTANKPNPSVLASAVGSNDLKGRRGKLIMDDIEGEDARWSPQKREQLYSWLKLEAWRCYEDRMESDRPLLCLLGTPFDVDSIYFRVESQGWKVIRYPVYKREEWVDRKGKNGTTDKVYKVDYLWPEKQEKVEKARRALRALEFSVAYRMDPTGGDPSRVSAAQIADRMGEAGQVSEEFAGFIALDPAAGAAGPRVDYAGLAVVKVRWPQGDELPEVQIHEAHSVTQGLFEQVHLCAKLYEQYNYPVIFERNAQQGEVYHNAFRHLHPDVPLLTHYTSQQNKFDTSMGLTVVRRLVVDRKLFVPPEALETDGVQQLIQEIRDLQPPFKLHNHISAAIWFAVRFCYDKVRHYKGPTIRTTYAPLDPMTGSQQVWGVSRRREGWRPTISTVYGYSMQGQTVLQCEMRKEVELFVKRQQGPEALKRQSEADRRRYTRMMVQGNS